MTPIKAIIKPFRLEKVVNNLPQVKGLPAADHLDNARTHDLVLMTELEIVVSDEQVEPLVETIQKATHTSHAGDGQIFVLPVEEGEDLDRGTVGAVVADHLFIQWGRRVRHQQQLPRAEREGQCDWDESAGRRRTVE